MLSRFNGVSRRAWQRVVVWTLAGPLVCIAISLAFVWLTLSHLQADDFRGVVIVATVLPAVIAAPLFFLHSLKLRELAIANHKLHDLASLDGLTGCLNRSAFQAKVQHWLQTSAQGALLIIDADHFKSINDTYGHDSGDEALKVIATAIRTAIRSDDICGRIGGEEFGVYMPNVASHIVLDVAERLRAAVSEAAFAPDGQKNLSVSVGCAVHTHASTYAELFSIADEQLYVAKELGRNRVRVTTFDQAAQTRMN